MKKLFLVLLIFLVLMFSELSVGEEYTLPGSTEGGVIYNNIGLSGELLVDLNVTIVNTAPYPKYILINPRYDFRVIRRNKSEYFYNNRTFTGNLEGFVSRELLSKSLNYQIGFLRMKQ